LDRNLRTMPNMKRYFAKAKFVERLLHLFALDLKSTPISFCRCPLHGLCRVYALAAGPNIYSTFVLQFLLIMMMLDPLLLIPCLEIRRFLGGYWKAAPVSVRDPSSKRSLLCVMLRLLLGRMLTTFSFDFPSIIDSDDKKNKSKDTPLSPHLFKSLLIV
jgi:hypothetical protein